MPGHVDEADTSAKRTRETREERVARAIVRELSDQQLGTHAPWDDPEFRQNAMRAARAAIEAYPDPPRQKKERGAPKSDKDSCALYAQRGEFQELYDAMQLCGAIDDFPRAEALLRALKEQGVVS